MCPSHPYPQPDKPLQAFQGIVLSSFFAGYAGTQLLGGQLADRLGGKLVLTVGISLWSIFTAAIPGAAAMGTAPLLASRVMLGLGEGSRVCVAVIRWPYYIMLEAAE